MSPFYWTPKCGIIRVQKKERGDVYAEKIKRRKTYVFSN